MAKTVGYFSRGHNLKNLSARDSEAFVRYFNLEVNKDPWGRMYNQGVKKGLSSAQLNQQLRAFLGDDVAKGSRYMMNEKRFLRYKNKVWPKAFGATLGIANIGMSVYNFCEGYERAREDGKDMPWLYGLGDMVFSSDFAERKGRELAEMANPSPQPEMWITHPSGHRLLVPMNESTMMNLLQPANPWTPVDEW